MLTFQFKGKKYRASSALEVVRVIERETKEYPFRGRSIREFLRWSLDRLSGRIPVRELDLSDRLEDEELALSYLYLQDEFGTGKLAIGKTNADLPDG
jgi:hypothetical protein